MGDLIAFPPNRPRGPQPKHRLDDIRMVPFENQPPAITLPGEPWRLNAYHMSQLIVIRDGRQVIVGEMQTVRDAAAAVQSRAIVELLARAKSGGFLTPEYVTQVMERYGR
jgi:hypothetical protein